MTTKPVIKRIIELTGVTAVRRATSAELRVAGERNASTSGVG